jgi:hypothetical protein
MSGAIWQATLRECYLRSEEKMRAAQQRSLKLAAKLQALGIDPNKI